MSKKYFGLIVALIIIVCLAACKSENMQERVEAAGDEQKITEDARLIVFGEEALDVNLYINPGHGYALLPLTATLKEICPDVSIEWESETRAVLEYSGERYILSADKCAITKEGNGDYNYIIPAPGGSFPRYYAEKYELMLDSTGIETVAMMFGSRIICRVNYQSKTVEIVMLSDALNDIA